MISKKYRFHGHGSLRYVYQNGKTVRSSLMSLKFVANSHRPNYRLAVVVSKKVNKSAVARNRIRRRLYEAVRRQQENIGPYDMVITVFGELVATIPADGIEKSVAVLLKNAKIIN